MLARVILVASSPVASLTEHREEDPQRNLPFLVRSVRHQSAHELEDVDYEDGREEVNELVCLVADLVALLTAEGVLVGSEV